MQKEPTLQTVNKCFFKHKMNIKDYVCPYLHFLCHSSNNYQASFTIDRIFYSDLSAINAFFKEYYPKLKPLTEKQYSVLQNEIPDHYATIGDVTTTVHVPGISLVNESLQN